ncbi:MAG TPA: hypothetical protein VKO42_01805 [Patescibacteria group bacterium]|nr:hypothetical protein [Patescibacteria group bacterium]
MPKNNGFENIGDIFKKKQQTQKPPAYQWQDLALRVIKELNIPNFKRSSVFKACKGNSRQFIEQCLADTKELCDSKDKWRYFFKIVNERNSDSEQEGSD